MLTGSGAYGATVTQLTMAVVIHQLSQTLAHKALLSVPEKKKSPPYAAVRQGLSEPYGQFIDHLSAALKDATELSEELQETMFQTLAFENANRQTKTILATLPQGAGVDKMLVHATCAEQSSQTAAFTATLQNVLQQQEQVIAAALTRGVPSKWCRATHTRPRSERAQSASAPEESDATTSTAGTLGPLSQEALGEAADVAE